LIKILPVLLLLAGAAAPVRSQSGREEPFTLIGLSLTEVLARFGPPQAVYPVRGLAEWQDDVVFEYEDQDLYVYRDRIWQLGLKTACGISLGDTRQLVLLIFGEKARIFPGYILVSLPESSWPLCLRVNLDSQDKVSGLFIYRSDF
jgi:hypothetical protein